MYVKVKNLEVFKFPYSKSMLKKDNPNTSFPKNIPDSLLAEYDVFPVIVEPLPTVDNATQKVETATEPSFNGTSWVLIHTIVSKTQDEINEYAESAIAESRAKRDNLLNLSDWTQLPDAPVDATAWAAYRQALRDITTHANWPHLSESDWPVKP